MLRIQTPLPEDLEALVRNTIGCCITVHRELGPGLIEGIIAKHFAASLQQPTSPTSVRGESR